MFVKICGITNEEDALLAVALGADAVGFVFAPSTRQVHAERVRDIVQAACRRRCCRSACSATSGPSTSSTSRQRRRACTPCSCPVAEPSSEVRWIRERVRFVIQGSRRAIPRSRSAANSPADVVLIDSPNPGSGKVFDWRLAEGAPGGVRLMLAGGLTPDNVGRRDPARPAVGRRRRDRRRSRPGPKDPRKLRQFIEAARDAADEIDDRTEVRARAARRATTTVGRRHPPLGLATRRVTESTRTPSNLTPVDECTRDHHARPPRFGAAPWPFPLRGSAGTARIAPAPNRSASAASASSAAGTHPRRSSPRSTSSKREFRHAWHDDAFRAEYAELLGSYAGRPTPVTECRRLSERLGVRVLLKREDLTHTGSHKINNVLGQALLTQRMGKQRVIAETGAGQHGVATATAAALFGLDCTVYMGAVDVERQALNVWRMRLLGAGGRARAVGQRDAEGRRQRGDARVGRDRHRHPLLHRFGDGTASVPVDGARVPARRRRRSDARSRRRSSTAPTPTSSSRASAAGPTRSARLPGSSTPTRGSSASKPAGSGSSRATTAPP